MLTNLLHHPRKFWIRRALFQVHLWLGVLLSLYVAVIGLSGSVLVWEDELRAASMPELRFDPNHLASVDTAIAQARAHYPGKPLTYIMLPSKLDARWRVFLNDRGKSVRIYADAATGVPFEEKRSSFLEIAEDLHIYLLAGRTGFVVNCVCGIGLLVLALTGVVLWWPGVRLWRRGFLIAVHARWQRINFDTHNAVGIWTLLIVSFWGVTAVYFLFPTQVTAMVNAVSPLKGMKEPDAPKVTHRRTTSVAMQTIVDAARKVSPGHVSGLFLPATPGGNVSVDVQRTPGDFSHRDEDVFDSSTGQLVQQWHVGNLQSVGDWVLWLMYPLHFGTLWGTSVKVLWSLLGLSLPVLSLTGLLMYWNRLMRKRWYSLKS